MHIIRLKEVGTNAQLIRAGGKQIASVGGGGVEFELNLKSFDLQKLREEIQLSSNSIHFMCILIAYYVQGTVPALTAYK